MPDIVPQSRKKTAMETRRRILCAAEMLSRTIGPARMSLEAVAAEAAVSKGGLLYHFPSKHHLLRALVDDHVAEMRDAMQGLAPGCLEEGAPCATDPLAAAQAYLAVIRTMLHRADAPKSGVFAALSEDPHFIVPLLAFREDVLAIFRLCPNPDTAAIVFLACEGLIHQRLISPADWDVGRVDALFVRLEAMLRDG